MKANQQNSETNQTKNGYLVLASRLVFDDKLPIRFLYKTVPEHLNDTGWRLYTGYETPEYLEDEVANMAAVPMDKITNLDPSLAPLLEYNAGTVWERTPEATEWQRVYDFKIPTHSTDVDISNDIERFQQADEI